MHVQMFLFCQSKPIAFLPFSLMSPLSLLKLFNGAVRLCKPTGAMESLSALSAHFLRSFANLHNARIHMTSRRPYWFSKTMKRRPCWWSKQILWGWTLFLCKKFFFVPVNLHRCWPREWIRSIIHAPFSREFWWGYCLLLCQLFPCELLTGQKTPALCQIRDTLEW